MIIKILGTGCPNCKKLEANTREALKQLNRNDDVVKITDMSEIVSYGVMSLPGLVFDEKVMTYGIIPSVEDVKKILAKND
jgi:small redox-active disulfide protein 2